MKRPNPLTDELSDEAKAILAAKFSRMRAMFGEFDPIFEAKVNRIMSVQRRRPWELICGA